MDALILIGSLLVLLLVGFPVAFAVGLSAFIGAWWIDLPLEAVVIQITNGINKFSLLTIPFFILAGAIMAEGGIARRLVNFAYIFVGFIRGGLSLVNIVASTFFGAISGSSVADTASIGSVMIPQMEEKGYPRDFAAAVTASGSVQAVLTPPSHNSVIYSLATGGMVTISSLFVAGILPGLMLGGCLMVMCLGFARKRGYPKGERIPFRQALKIFFDAFWGLFTVVIIMGGILSGIFTASDLFGHSAQVDVTTLQQHHLSGNITQRGFVVSDHAGKDVVDHHRRNRSDQTHRRCQQRFGDTGSHHRKVRRLGFRNTDKAVHDAPDSAEQTNKRGDRADGCQEAIAPACMAAESSHAALKAETGAIFNAVGIFHTCRQFEFILRIVQQHDAVAVTGKRLSNAGGVIKTTGFAQRQLLTLQAALSGAEFSIFAEKDCPCHDRCQQQANHDDLYHDIGMLIHAPNGEVRLHQITGYHAASPTSDSGMRNKRE